MIALALLPGFSTINAGYSESSVGIRIGFMTTSCTLAYLIKLFYFDVVDDLEQTTWLVQGGIKSVRHALASHAEGEHELR